MSIAMGDQRDILDHASQHLPVFGSTEVELRCDKDSHADEDTVCDTCSGEGSSADLDDDVVSLCSWTTDQGDWDMPFGMVSSFARDHFLTTTMTSECSSQDGDNSRDSVSAICSVVSHEAEARHGAAAGILCPDACMTFVPVFVPMHSAWQMEDYTSLQAVAAAPGEWHVPGTDQARGQQKWAKPLGSQQKLRQRKQDQRQSWQLQKPSIQTPEEAERNEEQRKTTLIFRNCPNECGRDTLVQVLDAEGFAGLYDFVHLPVEFHSSNALGYAIVNMVSHSVAERALQHFSGFDRWPARDAKPCEMAWNNPLQGLAAHVDRYRNSPLMHQSVPETYRPLLFRKGARVSFPKPTMRIRAPRIRNHW